MFSKLFPSKELKKFKDILNKLEVIYRNPSFNIVKKRLEDWAIKNPNNLKKILTQDIDYELWLNGHVANISGDLVESGSYHLYRGVLNPLGQGENLLRLFDQATDFSLNKGEFDKEFAEKQKRMVRTNIKTVG